MADTSVPDNGISGDQHDNQPVNKDKEVRWRWPIIRLVLIPFWIFWHVVPQAINTGVSGKRRLLLNTLIYCTTPETILVLLGLLIWFTIGYSKYRSSIKASRDGKGHLPDLAYKGSVLIITVFLGFVAYEPCHSAWEQRLATDSQMQAQGVNPDALKGWEIMNQNPNIGDAKKGLSQDVKKRMREQFALECRGELASTEGVSVELKGESHDRLIFTVDGALATNARELVVDALRQNDPDFGNRLRFLNFSEMILAGTNYSETFSRTDFNKWSQGYGAFVSNAVATYSTAGNQNSFFSKGDEISPEMQKTLRSRLAAILNGGIKSIDRGIDVELAGTNSDVLIVSYKDGSEQDMNDLLNKFRQDETGDFFDGLTACGFSEFRL